MHWVTPHQQAWTLLRARRIRRTREILVLSIWHPCNLTMTKYDEELDITQHQMGKYPPLLLSEEHQVPERCGPPEYSHQQCWWCLPPCQSAENGKELWINIHTRSFAQLKAHNKPTLKEARYWCALARTSCWVFSWHLKWRNGCFLGVCIFHFSLVFCIRNECNRQTEKTKHTVATTTCFVPEFFMFRN